MQFLDRKQNGNIYYERGLAFYQNADYAHAIEDFSRAILDDQRSRDALRNRSRALYQKGEYLCAIEDYIASVSFIKT
jgi:tetratricopeptide (TPR) repeat protein